MVGASPRDSERWAETFAEFPLHKALGLSLEERREGFARICMRPSTFTLGGVGGSVHGGLLAALVDIAMLEALSTTFDATTQAMGTADLNITYLRPALGARIYAEATVLRKGRSLAVTEVSIVDDEGRLCAKGRTIYSLRTVGDR
ncbi:MAG: PaaI family thioesterase [Chloroflexi bacterium]|nr:PaaI family thioesterase [Chloroflexota bacterium]